MENSELDAATTRFYESYVAEGVIAGEASRSAMSRYFALAFKSGDKVLDIGSGSGRDLAVMISQGVDVYGIEPNDAMRAFALANVPGLAGRIQPGLLPLADTPFGGNFDGVVCSAVLMHIPEDRLSRAWESIRRILAPGGKVLFSLPVMRADLLTDGRDSDGRLFTNHSLRVIGAMLKSLGFSRMELDGEATAKFADVTWAIFLFALTTHP